ncbi:MAG: trypsin-like peptidase domain-containing protein [Elusimicrobia bacterium]|nr:trypsin-like peptidase domain-containing protein [Elusimicrobiota bacterium]
MNNARTLTKSTIALALCLAVSRLDAASDVELNVIYGDDNRLDLHQVDDPELLSWADSTVALFDASRLTLDAENGRVNLRTDSYADDYNLCHGEPFRDQKHGAFCSGSLVGPDLVMTAGHCVSSAGECQSTRFVFGFAIREAGALPESVAASEVYGCAQIIGSAVVHNGADWSLIRLDRPVNNHQPRTVNRSGTIKNGTQLVVIGHPAGLPTKVAGGAWVRDSSPTGYFVANLDTYGGNSGSAVFNADTGAIEGILVRGERDYEDIGGCRVSKVCKNEECRGEDVTKISALARLIPSAQNEALADSGDEESSDALAMAPEAASAPIMRFVPVSFNARSLSSAASRLGALFETGAR